MFTCLGSLAWSFRGLEAKLVQAGQDADFGLEIIVMMMERNRKFFFRLLGLCSNR